MNSSCRRLPLWAAQGPRLRASGGRGEAPMLPCSGKTHRRHRGEARREGQKGKAKAGWDRIGQAGPARMGGRWGAKKMGKSSLQTRLAWTGRAQPESTNNSTVAFIRANQSRASGELAVSVSQQPAPGRTTARVLPHLPDPRMEGGWPWDAPLPPPNAANAENPAP